MRFPARSISSAAWRPPSGRMARSFGSGSPCTAARRSCATPATTRARRLTAARGCGRSPTAARRSSRAPPMSSSPSACPRARACRPLGPQRLRDLARAEEVFELTHPELPHRLSAPALARRAAQQPPGPALELRRPRGELAEVGRLLADHRLVTLTGAGRLRQDPARRCRPPPRSSSGSPTASGGSSSRRWATSGWSARRSPRRSGCAPLPGMTELQACRRLPRLAPGAARARQLRAPARRRAPRRPRRSSRPLPRSWCWPRAGRRSGSPARPSWRVPSLSLPGTDGRRGRSPASDAVSLFVERAGRGPPGLRR